jgi:hypothetical protein
VAQKRDEIDYAIKLFRGEPVREGGVWRTEYPPDGTPIVKKYYLAAVLELWDIAGELIGIRNFSAYVMKHLDSPLDFGRPKGVSGRTWRRVVFLMALADAFDPHGSGRRKVTVGFRSKGDAERDAIRELTLSLEVEHLIATGVPKEKAYQQVAEAAGYKDDRQVRRYFRRYEEGQEFLAALAALSSDRDLKT